jgi:ferredoxin
VAAATGSAPGPRREGRPTGAVVRIGCQGASTGQRADLTLTLGCVGGLTAAQLIRLIVSGQRAILVEVRGCPGCRQRAAVSSVRTHLDLALKICEAASLPAPELTITEHIGPALKGREWMLPPRRPQRSLGEGRKSRISSWRHQLLVDLAGATPSAEPVWWQGWPFGRCDVGPACVGCGACAKLCPTGAAVHRLKTRERLVLFRPGLCVGCGICVYTCPVQARRVSHRVDLRDLVGMRERLLASHPRRACRRCGGETLVDDCCPTCLRRAPRAAERPRR